MRTIRPNYPYNDDFSSSTANISNIPSVKLAGPVSPFGELMVGELNPSFQIDFIDGVINQSTVKTFVVGAGASVSTLRNEVSVNGGTDASSFAMAVSKRVVPYQPGQGTIARFTSRFGAPDANVYQSAGLHNGVSSYKFAYHGTSFGIHYRRTGEREIRALTITAGSTTTGSATITLDGSTISIPLTNAAGNTSKTAYEIARIDFANIGDGWTVDIRGSVVYFISLKPKPYSGSFSFSHGSATGTFSTLTAGENPTEEFIPQSSWNIDVMNGGGSSKVTFNPLNANVYEIKFQYLGYGDAIFSIESTEESVFIPVHIIKNAGNTAYPIIRSPLMFMCWAVENNGIPSSAVTMYAASAAGFVAGVKKFLGPKFAYSVSKSVTAIGIFPIFTIKTSRVFNNTAAVTPLRLGRITIGAEINKPGDIYVYANAALDTANFTNYKTGISRAVIDTSATTVNVSGVGTRLIGSYSLGKSSHVSIDVFEEDLDVQAGEFITFCINSNATGVNQDISISVTWFEG